MRILPIRCGVWPNCRRRFRFRHHISPVQPRNVSLPLFYGTRCWRGGFAFTCVVKRFIANAGDSDQKVPMTREASIANNDLFTVVELPTTRAQHDHHLALIKNWHQ